MQAGKSVILCASQRTGSSLIFDDLLNVAGCKRTASELLYERIILEKTQRPWSEVWEEVSQKSRIPGYFVGKVMFHYTPRISNFIERYSAEEIERCLEFAPELFDAFYNFFRDAIWVYIERRNVFAQAVSMYLAETTNVWRRLVEEPQQGDVPIPAVAYEYGKLKEYLQGFLAEREQWQNFFRHYKITPIRISYEDAASGYPDYLKELLDRIGLKTEAPPRRMIKLGGQRNEEWAEFLRNDVILELYSRIHAGT